MLAENEKAQNTFKEAVTKTEDAKRILAQAKALNDTFDKCVRDKVSHVKRNKDIAKTIRQWFVNRWKNCCDWHYDSCFCGDFDRRIVSIQKCI